MKKIFLYVILIAGFHNTVWSQQLNDVGRIILNSHVIDPLDQISQEAKNLFSLKLSQIAIENGIVGVSIDPRFLIAGKLNIFSKDIIAGPPQMIAYNVEFVFFVGDAEDNKIFSTTSFNTKGVGTNETKALISAIQNINSKSKSFSEFIYAGKSKIENYYTSHCDIIISKANTLIAQEHFEEGIFQFMKVPEVCKDCYKKCLFAASVAYQKKINKEGLVKLNQAKLLWNTNQNSIGAKSASELLSEINPIASCQKEATNFVEIIRRRIESIDKQKWEFQIQKYKDGIKLEEYKIEASKKIAISYYQNQPKTIIYNRVIW